jgi:hypothetical protein
VRTDASAEGAADQPGERDRIALDGDVDVEALLAEQDVPDGAADEVDALDRLARRGDPVEDRAQPLESAQLRGDALSRFGRRLPRPRARAAGRSA